MEYSLQHAHWNSQNQEHSARMEWECRWHDFVNYICNYGCPGHPQHDEIIALQQLALAIPPSSPGDTGGQGPAYGQISGVHETQARYGNYAKSGGDLVAYDRGAEMGISATALHGGGPVERYASAPYASGPARVGRVSQALPSAAVGIKAMRGARDVNDDRRSFQDGSSYYPALPQPPALGYEGRYHAARDPSTAVYPTMDGKSGHASASRTQDALSSPSFPRCNIYTRDDGFSGDVNHSRNGFPFSRGRHGPRGLPSQQEDEYSRDYPSDHLYIRSPSRFEDDLGYNNSRGLTSSGTTTRASNARARLEAGWRHIPADHTYLQGCQSSDREYDGHVQQLTPQDHHPGAGFEYNSSYPRDDFGRSYDSSGSVSFIEER